MIDYKNELILYGLFSKIKRYLGDCVLGSLMPGIISSGEVFPITGNSGSCAGRFVARGFGFVRMCSGEGDVVVVRILGPHG